MFSNIKLKELRDTHHFSQSYIASELKISRMSYCNWESGKTVPNKKNLSALAKIFDVEPTYFESQYAIVDTYLKLNRKNQQNLETYADRLLQKQEQESVIPLFPVQVLSDVELSAGLGQALFDEKTTETVYSNEEQYGYDIAAWINGDSMEPIYKSGEVALIRANGFDYDGAVYALSWNETVYIKKLYREKEGFRMVSLNKKYPDQFIPYEDELKIVGLVVSHFMPVVGV